MTLGDAIRKVVADRDIKGIGKIADYLRFNKGFSYRATFQLVNHCTGIDPADWDELLREGE